VLFEYRYFGSTEVSSSSSSTGLSFAPDTRRQATFLTGNLRQKLPFRETMSALHHVVVSDLRFRPRDKSEYLEWRRKQDDLDLAQIGSMRRENATQLATLRQELEELRARHARRLGPFAQARKRFFDFLYKKSIDAWFVLDPVITVHPDEVAFECFSQDESSYGRLSCSHEVFEQLGELAYGTTNIDYSHTLYDEFQKIREDKTTSFQIDPGGFEVQTGTDETYREVKIDLPDSWVRGFLQVGTAMGLPGGVRLKLHPLDVHNLCFVLRRHKEVRSPRSLRFVLEPDRPVRILVEPFGIWVECPRSSHDTPDAREIRIWGRRRLFILERMLPVARSISVTLLGSGMPSFWVADCGDLTFTLGLSGWTANDWSGSANFDLLAPRGQVDNHTAGSVMDALRQRWLATPDELARATGFERGTVESALVAFAQAGRTMYDLHRGVWRLRELTREPLDLSTIRFANEREGEAAALVDQGQVRVQVLSTADGKVALAGRAASHQPSLTLNEDQRLVAGQCNCTFFYQNKLRKGPCAHLLALRLAFQRKVGLVEADPRMSNWTPAQEPAVSAGRPVVRAEPEEPEEDEDSGSSRVSIPPRTPLEMARDAMEAFRKGGTNLAETQSLFARATDRLKLKSPRQAAVLASVVTELSRLRSLPYAEQQTAARAIFDRFDRWLAEGAPAAGTNSPVIRVSPPRTLPPEPARGPARGPSPGPEDDEPNEFHEVLRRRQQTPQSTQSPQAAPPRLPLSPAQLAEGERFLSMLVERSLLELDEGRRADLVGAVAQVLAVKGKAQARARQMWPLFERHTAVIEFYLLDVEDLTALLEDWG
jgi:hypothetical protein